MRIRANVCKCAHRSFAHSFKNLHNVSQGFQKQERDHHSTTPQRHNTTWRWQLSQKIGQASVCLVFSLNFSLRGVKGASQLGNVFRRVKDTHDVCCEQCSHLCHRWRKRQTEGAEKRKRGGNYPYIRRQRGCTGLGRITHFPKKESPAQGLWRSPENETFQSEGFLPQCFPRLDSKKNTKKCKKNFGSLSCSQTPPHPTGGDYINFQADFFF